MNIHIVRRTVIMMVIVTVVTVVDHVVIGTISGLGRGCGSAIRRRRADARGTHLSLVGVSRSTDSRRRGRWRGGRKGQQCGRLLES